MANKADRERAARFYLKPDGIDWGTRDWIDGMATDHPIDDDVRDLANEFARYRLDTLNSASQACVNAVGNAESLKCRLAIGALKETK